MKLEEVKRQSSLVGSILKSYLNKEDEQVKILLSQMDQHSKLYKCLALEVRKSIQKDGGECYKTIVNQNWMAIKTVLESQCTDEDISAYVGKLKKIHFEIPSYYKDFCLEYILYGMDSIEKNINEQNAKKSA